jgi:hypothetical protein
MTYSIQPTKSAESQIDRLFIFKRSVASILLVAPIRWIDPCYGDWLISSRSPRV